jgi:hypothetical protein
MIAQIKIVPTACFATKIDKSKITKEAPAVGLFYCRIYNTFVLFYIAFSLILQYIYNTR